MGISWEEGGSCRFKLLREPQCATPKMPLQHGDLHASQKSQVTCHVSEVLLVAEPLFPSILGCLHSITMLLWLMTCPSAAQACQLHQSLLKGL